VSDSPEVSAAALIDVIGAAVNPAGLPIVRAYRVPLGTTAAVLVHQTDAFQNDFQIEPLNPAAKLPPMGVFSLKIAEPEGYILQDGDRLELYQPLILNPMEVRRARARVHPVGRRMPRVNGRR
jgi:putative ubiquitin-RnfH superfamily antitoxin RatB of RatAB toxin-antitoxin module